MGKFNISIGKSCFLVGLVVCGLFFSAPSFIKNAGYDKDFGIVEENKCDPVSVDPVIAQTFKVNTNLSVANASFLGEEAGAYSGCSVAGVGDVNNDGYADYAVGAYKQDTASGVDSGKVYLVLGNSTSNLRTYSSLGIVSASFIGESAYSLTGYSVAGSGDVNNDGFDDILIGAYNTTYGGVRAGKAYLLYGGPGILHQNLNLSLANASFIGEASLDQAGFAVAGVGDVNDDNYDDILIGAPFNSGGGTRAGKVYLFYGNSTASESLHANLNVTAANASFVGTVAYDYTGSALAGAGDVNNEGHADFLIGAYGNDDGGDMAGKAYLVYGADTGVLTYGMAIFSAAGASFIGETASDRLGYSVAGPGDINNDGYADILIGAYAHSGTYSNDGNVYLFFGNNSAMLHADMTMDKANASFSGKAVSEYAGYSLAGAGDINRDGYHDFLIGAYGSNTGGVGAGAIYLIYGNSTEQFALGMSLSKANASFYGEASGESAGTCVSGVGDVDGDGFVDLAFGVQSNDISGLNAGKTYLFLGPDNRAPGNITNLLGSSPGPNYITLSWTAPGDDGMNGNVSGYLVKYSQSPITDLNFDAAQSFDTSAWIPLVKNGSLEVRMISDLMENREYYFALKGLDDWKNAGNMSNVVSIWTISVPPSGVSDLAVITVTPTTATLRWTAPGDNGVSGTVAGYLVKYSKYPINDANFSSAPTYDTTLWAPFAIGGDVETRVITGLTELTWYYFAIKAYDSAGNYGLISNVPHNVTASQPPAAVTDLELKFPTLGGFILSWTAPGDDGMTGTVSGYVVKYSTTPIVEGNFSLADTYVQSWTSLAPGGLLESRTITGLNASTLYYFALKAYDGVFNVGGISNLAMGYTTTDTSVPQVTSPADLTYVEGTTGHEIQWTLADGTVLLPRYNLSVDSTEKLSSVVWMSGQTITYSVDGLSLGRHTVTIIVSDGYGNVNTDAVTITVTSAEAPGPSLFEWIAIGMGAIAFVAFLSLWIALRKKPAFRGEFMGRKDIPVQGKTLPRGKGKPDSGASYKEPVPAGKEVQPDLKPIPPETTKDKNE